MPTFFFCFMRVFLVFVFLLHCPLSAQQWLDTPSYWIRLSSDCKQLQGCNKVRYEGRSKVTGAAISIEGHSWWVGNQQQPLFWGYRFHQGRLHYVLHSSGLLQVTNRKGHVLVEEHGRWLQQAPPQSDMESTK